MIEFLSFNTLSKYYANLQERDNKAIAGNSFRINDYMLGQWSHVLSVLRNTCTHNGYLYRRDYPLRHIMANFFGWDSSKNNRLFALFLVMRRLSERTIWHEIIQILDEEIDTILYLKRL